MAHLKRSIVEVKAEENSLAHALVEANAQLDKDPNYKAYRQGWKIRQVVETLLETIGIDLLTVWGFPNYLHLRKTFGSIR